MTLKQNQNGNVLFLILIAVALFAALSYAVTRSSRGGGNAASEKQGIEAARIIEMIGDVKFAYQRMRISGVALDDIDISPGSLFTPCTTGEDCLWASEGGNVLIPEHESITQPIFLEIVDNYSVSNMGTASADLILALDIDLDMCEEVNSALGLTVPVEIDGNAGNVFADGISYAGEEIFCEGHSNSPTNYHIIIVLESQ